MRLYIEEKLPYSAPFYFDNSLWTCDRSKNIFFSVILGTHQALKSDHVCRFCGDVSDISHCLHCVEISYLRRNECAEIVINFEQY